MGRRAFHQRISSSKSVEDIVGFGAEQVILVRDNRTKTEVCEFVGKNALVLTTVEYKGLEFQIRDLFLAFKMLERGSLESLTTPTTLTTTIPRFEENSGQCFSSDEVDKEELILTLAVDKGDFTRPILAVKEDLVQKLIDDLDEPLMVLEPDGMINKNEFAVVAPVVAVAPFVVAPIAVAPVAPVIVTPVEPSFIPLGRKIKQNQAEQKLGCEICL
ncbi:hypothetical protein Tco_1095746 [Tanacetum coccineum]